MLGHKCEQRFDFNKKVLGLRAFGGNNLFKENLYELIRIKK